MAGSGKPTTTAARWQSDLRQRADGLGRRRRRRAVELPMSSTLAAARAFHRPDLGVGDGIFKSSDGGHERGSTSAWADIQQVGRIVVHPTRPRHRLRGRHGPPVWSQRRARRVSHRPMAAERGRRCSSSIATPARHRWRSIRRNPRSSLRGAVEPPRRRRGRTAALRAANERACSSRPTAAPRGTNSPAACRTARRELGRISVRDRADAIRAASTHSCRRVRHARGVTAPTMRGSDVAARVSTDPRL